MRLLVATRSVHKLREIREMLADASELELVGPDEAGVPYDPREEDLEPWPTFEENAVSKARWFHARSGLPTVADDSGLEVDALEGAPGVRSKRFASVAEGVEGDARDEANNRHLLALLRDRPGDARRARYVCVLALVEGEGEPLLVRGQVEGIILEEPRGDGGFGYDPLFGDPELGKSFAEIAPEEKNARSHRGEAFRALAARLVSRTGG